MQFCKKSEYTFFYIQKGLFIGVLSGDMVKYHVDAFYELPLGGISNSISIEGNNWKQIKSAVVASLMVCKDIPDDVKSLLQEPWNFDTMTIEVNETEVINPQVLSFIERILDRAKSTGAFMEARKFVQRRFKTNPPTMDFCLSNGSKRKAHAGVTSLGQLVS